MSFKIHASEMKEVLTSLFLKYGFIDNKAKTIAHVHTENTLYGVNSHGINRVPLFIEYIKKGIIKIDSEAERIDGFGSIERWDGNHASGVLNAINCTERAIELAKNNGMGLVALRNTNHWMRGGYYGWQAAEENCISILFTNTQPNMPAWGGKESRIGNNPIIISIPRKKGHVVLDMALSQFSFGKIDDYRLKGKKLTYPGGWDKDDNLTTDPEKILVKERGLPIGYWKGSALSMVLDMLATLLSAGNSTYKIGLKEYETGISQIFLCIHADNFHDKNIRERLLEEIIDYTQSSTPMKEDDRIYYPGERSLFLKMQNLHNGIQVSEKVWKRVHELNS